MKPSLLASFLVLALPHAGFAQTLCMPGETDHFSCPVGAGKKILSICSNIKDDAIDEGSWLQYRFGARDKIELAFPKEKEGSIARFEGNVFNPREQPIETADLRFMHGKTSYSVGVSRISPGDGEKATVFVGGVDVGQEKARPVSIQCDKVDSERYYEGFKRLNYALQSKSAGASAELKRFVEPGTRLVSVDRADMSGDGTQDYLVVLQRSDTTGTRALLIIGRDQAGALTLLKRNELIVGCADCGGAMGDPLQEITVRSKGFTVSNAGGSVDRWANSFTFAYSQRDKTWQLVRAQIATYDAPDPDDYLRKR